MFNYVELSYWFSQLVMDELLSFILYPLQIKLGSIYWIIFSRRCLFTSVCLGTFNCVCPWKALRKHEPAQDVSFLSHSPASGGWKSACRLATRVSACLKKQTTSVSYAHSHPWLLKISLLMVNLSFPRSITLTLTA